MELQKSLKQVSDIELNVRGSALTEEIQKASQAALELSSHLTHATNVKTGQIDFPKLQSSLKASGKDLKEYAYSLAELGPQGKQAFLNLAKSVATAEIPLKRTNTLIDKAYAGLKKTIGWQLSSSIVHGFVGSVQQAMGYAQDLNKSLTDIRIVTGASSEQMASFAKEANAAAKALNATTTDYTKAALIYYQQGLSEADVKARTETTIKMANVTGTSAKEVSNQMTAIWNNYDNGTKSLEYYADAMAALGAKTASSTDEIAEGLQKFASISQTVGLSYEYAASALATITSTSRESADVVGNALKTLFSRIQGLSLGETLEDGTTLNKYSAALAKVGISVKDTSGQLKDMDIILDEMGMTWNTLARDEKMALAQTVAGVRQYTQLITLMDNWSFFKENVQTAKSSEGTLNAQAAIFAESWQAASNKVRTSWEGLWDNLINSDSFISILDGFSTLIDMLDSLINGMGGAGGVLSSFGGLLLSTFSPQITKNIKEIGYSLSTHMPGFFKKQGEQKANALKEMQNILNDGSFVMDKRETTVTNANLTRMAEEAALREQRYANMNAQEKVYAQEIEKRLQDNRTRQQQLAREMDSVAKGINVNESVLGNGLNEQWGQSQIQAAQSAINKAQQDIDLINEDIRTADKNHTSPTMGSFAELKAERARLQAEIQQNQALITGTQQRGIKSDAYATAANAAVKFEEQFKKQFWDNIKDNNDIIDPKAAKQTMQNLLANSGLVFDSKMIDEEFAKMTGSDSSNRAAIRGLMDKIIDTTFQTMAEGGEVDPAKIEAAKQYMHQQYSLGLMDDEMSGFNTTNQKFQEWFARYNEPKVDKTQGAINAAAAAMSVLAVTQSASALGEAFSALSTSAGSVGDVFSALVGTFSSMAQTFVTTGNALGNLVPALSKTVGKTGITGGGWIGIALAATTAIIAGINGHLEHQKKLKKEENERLVKEGEQAKERLAKNKELTNALSDNIVAVQQTSAAYKKGEVSLDDKIDSQKQLNTQISSSINDYSPEVITSVLQGDMAAAQDYLFQDRMTDIKSEMGDIGEGLTAAGNLMLMNAAESVTKNGLYGGMLYSDQQFIGASNAALGGNGAAVQFSKDILTNQFGYSPYAFDMYLKDREGNYLIDEDTEDYVVGNHGLNLKDNNILTNTEDFLEFYDAMESVYNQLLNSEHKNTNFTASVGEFLTANADRVETYRTSLEEYNKLAVEYEALNTDINGKKAWEINTLRDYKALREHLLTVYGEEEVDSILSQMSNLQNTEQGNLPMVYKALEGIFDNTDGKISMDNLIKMYEGIKTDMFNIDFKNLDDSSLEELSNILSTFTAGEPITIEAIIEKSSIDGQLRTILEQAQIIAEQNKITVAIEIVSDFNAEEDLYDSKKVNEYIKQYNLLAEKLGNIEPITLPQLLSMSPDEVNQHSKQMAINAKKWEIQNADQRYQDQKTVVEGNQLLQTEAQNAYSNNDGTGAKDVFLSAENDMSIDEKNTAIDYASEIARYNELLGNAGSLTDEERGEQLALKQQLQAAGIVNDSGKLNSAYESNIDEIGKVAESKNNLAEANANLANSETALLEIEDQKNNAALETSQLLVEEAALYGITAEALKQYAEYLKNTIPQLEGESAEAYQVRLEDAALNILKQQQGIAELAESYDDISKTLNKCEEGSVDWVSAMSKLKNILSKVLAVNVNKLSDGFVKAAKASGLLEKAAKGDQKALADLAEYSILAGEAIENGLVTDTELAEEGFGSIDKKVQELTQKELSGVDLSNTEQAFLDFANNVNTALEGIKPLNIGEIIPEGELHNAVGSALQAMDGFSGGLEGLADAASQFGLTPILEPVDMTNEASIAALEGQQVATQTGENSFEVTSNFSPANFDASSGATLYKIRYAKTGGGGAPSGGGGGGGGGGEPKKVANKRKSQTVKRYKKNDMRRSSAQSAKKSASTQKDYLYGESKIAQMEKINKLAAKEAAITSDRIKESRKYMIEDRENLIKYMQKYGYEADFDSDGFLNTYEEAWGKIHDKIAKLYEDNELTDDEKKLEEDYKVELEELDGALEDYENSLKELQSDIEAYEESLYEMYDNKVEQMQHKVEFRIELNEDDLSYLDFWIEALGDSLYNALESLQTMGAKTNVLFDGINTYKQGIEDIYALSDDPFQAWATGGLDDVLTADQVDALRENRDGLMDYMQQLLDLRQTMQDKVLDVFDKWQEKLSNTMSTIEHYGSVIEHFRNIMDVVGKDALGLDDQFMARFEQSAIDQSMDNIDATKAHYESLVSQNEEAQRRLAEARARGDKASEEHWQGVVDSTTEAMQSAQDSLLSSLESTLDMIASQFESAMTRAVEAFNDAIYEHGGLSGLSEDYSFMREQSDLMAQDYDKIYQLSKLNRNINKTLSDTNIIAGKQKMKSLQQEINELQASGVELSKYDLDYLQAKYELRLAEIELENAKNAKDTVRLSKDSEGNWSYIYTSSTDKVDEAQQKYEDALYAMQNLSYEYMEEMSNGMMQTSLTMMEKIQSLRIQDFDSYEAYAAEVKRIQDQYAGSLQNQQNELDKSMMNNQELYNQDWQAYSDMTGYKISAAQDWADNFSETTLGALMGSESSTSDFADTVFGLSNTLSNDLGTAAMSYFANVETAMNKYGTSINGFGSTVTTTVGNISTKSKTAANDMKTMAQEMNDAFTDITESVANWQKEFSGQIDSMLKEIGTLVQSINEAIQKSAEMTGTKQVGDLIGSAEAAELLSGHEEYDFGDWKMDGSQLKVKGVGADDYIATTFVEENAKLINEINKKLAAYTEARTGSEDRARLGEELEALFKKYHAFKDIVSRVYDPTTLGALDLDNPNYASMDTGGYTGEWGDSGKFAMLHEKELVLNQDDTKNFLDALSISREVLHSMIEMNAKQSSLALGDLYPSSIQDMSQMLEQQVSITAEFPNATNRSDIEDAFNSLINTASQYANRYK